MRIIHAGGFPVEERTSNKAVIYSNMVVAFKVLLDIMKTEEIDFESDDTLVSHVRTMLHAPALTSIRSSDMQKSSIERKPTSTPMKRSRKMRSE